MNRILLVVGIVLWAVVAWAEDGEGLDLTCGPEDDCIRVYSDFPPPPKSKELLWIESLEARIEALEEKYEAMFPPLDSYLHDCTPCGLGGQLLCCTQDD